MLNLYEATSRQKINTGKTSLFFSSNTGLETQELIKQALGAEIVPKYKKYLGLPSIVGRNKKAAFAPIIKNHDKRREGDWSVRLSSLADLSPRKEPISNVGNLTR